MEVHKKRMLLLVWIVSNESAFFFINHAMYTYFRSNHQKHISSPKTCDISGTAIFTRNPFLAYHFLCVYEYMVPPP